MPARLVRQQRGSGYGYRKPGRWRLRQLATSSARIANKRLR